jgi:hypothetical protein
MESMPSRDGIDSTGDGIDSTLTTDNGCCIHANARVSGRCLYKAEDIPPISPDRAMHPHPRRRYAWRARLLGFRTPQRRAS